MTNTRDTPVEALERAYPMRIRRYSLRRGSGGAGLAPGGEGIVKEWEFLTDVTVSLITERRVSRPWGLAGGESGAVGENWLLPQGDESLAKRLPDKVTVSLKAGDVLRMLTPGGGGWGPPPGAVPESLVILGEPTRGPVALVDPDRSWPVRFESEREVLVRALGVRARRVEHIGSTSVPALAAKPIVDVLVTVDDPDDDGSVLPALTAAGYLLRVIEPGHRMYRTADRVVHVHVWRAGGHDERRHLLFRDWLRHSEHDRSRYEAVKRVLAGRYWTDVNDYADAKTEVVAEITARAEEWAGTTGWRP